MKLNQVLYAFLTKEIAAVIETNDIKDNYLHKTKNSVTDKW